MSNKYPGKIYRFVLLFAVIFFVSRVYGLDPESEYIKVELTELQEKYLATLQLQARELKLADARYWHLLLHYKKGTFGGVESEADAETFFNAIGGKKSPEDELNETLRAFFVGDEKHPKMLHPQCRFVGRYHWLNERLRFDNNLLKPITCERFKKWQAAIKPENVTLVFASYYLNNPASMFGHTLLKLNKNRSGERHELLDYGINYAANVGGDVNPLVYMYLGLTGGFPGNFSIYPYYFKVNEYNNIESRDLWEYELDLKPEETDRLTRHLWEMGATYFDYYYFDENCSYQLLTMLEIARPTLRLSDKFFYVVQPVDTIRLLKEKTTLIRGTRLRASQMNMFLQKYRALRDEEKDVLDGILKTGKIDIGEMGIERQALLLDAGIEYLQVKKIKGGKKSVPHDEALIGNMLLSRSKIPEKITYPELKPFTSVDPATGHQTSGFVASGGYSTKGQYYSVGFTPALHSVNDDAGGFAPNSQILFSAIGARIYPDATAVPALEYWQLLDIVSIAPMERKNSDLSWKLSTGVQNLSSETADAKDINRLYYYARGGPGLSVGFTNVGEYNKIVFYTFLEGKIDVSPALNNTVRLAPVSSTGMLLTIFGIFNLNVSFTYYYYFFFERPSTPCVEIQNNLHLNNNFALQASYRHFMLGGNQEGSLAIKYYL